MNARKKKSHLYENALIASYSFRMIAGFECAQCKVSGSDFLSSKRRRLNLFTVANLLY